MRRERLLDLLLPRRCLVCGAPADVLCTSCEVALPRLRGPFCTRCGAATAWPVARCRECSGRRLAFASARAAVAYDDAVRSLVAWWKERGQRRVAVIAAELVTEVVPKPQVESLTWVPPDGDRSVRRGHHPAEQLAREVSTRWQLPAYALLRRSGSRRRQRGLALRERRRNVAGAFGAIGRAPARVVLVDDVYTSGATAGAAASALRRGGARRIEVVTFARVVR